MVSANTVQTLRLVLPESPALNTMIDLAKQRTRKARDGKWMKRSLPIVYDQRKEAYELQCMAALRGMSISPPIIPWDRWSIDLIEFRLHNMRDEIELLSSLKWPIDSLVNLGFVKDDSPRELVSIARPTQVIDRANRQITLVITRQ